MSQDRIFERYQLRVLAPLAALFGLLAMLSLGIHCPLGGACDGDGAPGGVETNASLLFSGQWIAGHHQLLQGATPAPGLDAAPRLRDGGTAPPGLRPYALLPLTSVPLYRLAPKQSPPVSSCCAPSARA